MMFASKRLQKKKTPGRPSSGSVFVAAVLLFGICLSNFIAMEHLNFMSVILEASKSSSYSDTAIPSGRFAVASFVEGPDQL